MNIPKSVSVLQGKFRYHELIESKSFLKLQPEIRTYILIRPWINYISMGQHFCTTLYKNIFKDDKYNFAWNIEETCTSETYFLLSLPSNLLFFSNSDNVGLNGFHAKHKATIINQTYGLHLSRSPNKIPLKAPQPSEITIIY